LNGGNPPNQSAENPPNITENTTETTAENVVVTREALKEFGLSDAVASQLASTYPEAYILAKLDLVRWLVENNSALVSKNPAGYLRRAIEQDYIPPPKYQTPDQRRAVAEANQVATAAEQEQRREAEAEYAREKAVAQQQLRERYPPEEIAGTALTTTTAWEQALDRLHGQLSRLNYETWLGNTALIGLADDTARIVAPSRFQAEHLTTRLQPLVAQTLSDVLGHPVDCRFIALPALLDAEPTPAGTAPPADSVDLQGDASRRLQPRDTADQALTTGPGDALLRP
jgi:hypothetical protein